MSVTVHHGDCMDVLRTLPDRSVHCCITSPPYWGLRDYQVGGQLGLEPTPAEHVAKMVEVFREVRRVLRDDGTLWLNYGDCYATSSNGRSAADTKALGTDDRTFRDKPFSTCAPRVGKSANKGNRAGDRNGPNRTTPPEWYGLKSKDLVGMPWRIAFALQADGWWLRSDIIWAKPNPMPESITDRPTKSHEYLFLLTKSARYFYDADAVREERQQDEDAATFRGGAYVGGEIDNGKIGKRSVIGNKRVKIPGGWDRGKGAHGTIHRAGRTSAEYQEAAVPAGRNLRDVWTIATAPYPEAHFATFPPALVGPCIKAGTSAKGCCPHCGSPWRRLVEKGAPDMEHRLACGADASGRYDGQSIKGHDAAGVQNASDVKRRILEGMREKITTGWEPTCRCADNAPIPCVVLDPFGGSGTVGLVANRLGRDAVLIELNPGYVAMAKRRIKSDAGMFAEVA